MMYGGYMNGWSGGYMMFVWFAVLAIVVYFVVRALGGRNNPSFQGDIHETALDILKKRYAAGEITTKEYEEKKHEIV